MGLPAHPTFTLHLPSRGAQLLAMARSDSAGVIAAIFALVLIAGVTDAAMNVGRGFPCSVEGTYAQVFREVRIQALNGTIISDQRGVDPTRSVVISEQNGLLFKLDFTNPNDGVELFQNCALEAKGANAQGGFPGKKQVAICTSLSGPIEGSLLNLRYAFDKRCSGFRTTFVTSQLGDDPTVIQAGTAIWSRTSS